MPSGARSMPQHLPAVALQRRQAGIEHQGGRGGELGVVRVFWRLRDRHEHFSSVRGRLARCPYLTGGLNGCQATMRSVASPHCRRLTPLGLPVTCSAGCTAVRWADVSAVWPARATRPVARSGTGGLCPARPVPAGAPDRRVAVEHRPQLAGRVPQMRRQGIKAHVECRVRRGAMLRLGVHGNVLRQQDGRAVIV